MITSQTIYLSEGIFLNRSQSNFGISCCTNITGFHRVTVLSHRTPPVYTALKRISTTLRNTTSMSIEGIQLFEEGLFVCVATSIYGTDEREFSVIFKDEINVVTRVLKVSNRGHYMTAWRGEISRFNLYNDIETFVANWNENQAESKSLVWRLKHVVRLRWIFTWSCRMYGKLCSKLCWILYLKNCPKLIRFFFLIYLALRYRLRRHYRWYSRPMNPSVLFQFTFFSFRNRIKFCYCDYIYIWTKVC